MRPILRNFRTNASQIELCDLARSKLPHRQAEIGDAIADAIDLANSALELFRGFYPAESLHYVLGDIFELPWGSEYKVAGPDKSFSLRPAELELRRCHRKVSSFIAEHPSEADANNVGLLYSDADARDVIEALSIAALIYFDELISCLLDGRLLTAIQWQRVAYQHLVEAALRAFRCSPERGASTVVDGPYVAGGPQLVGRVDPFPSDANASGLPMGVGD